MDGKIIFKNEQGENEEFTVLLETKVNNIKYVITGTNHTLPKLIIPIAV